MLIIGDKYRFTDDDIKVLKRKFKKLKFIKDNDFEKNKSYIKNQNIIILNSNKFSKKDFSHIDKIKIYTIEEFLEKYLYKIYIPNDNFKIDDIKPYSKFEYFLKRFIDYFFAIPLLLILPIVKFITKYKMQKEAPGSLYFYQNRVGKNNKIFKCIKFRTMYEHNSNKLVKTATKNDNRIYPWGRFLRRTRLDEIPQIINVLKGEMHLIGPRAEWDKLVQEYEKEIPYYNLRHIIAPGITGWAQVLFVEGKSKDDTKQKLMYDLYYIKHWNLWLELKTIWKTILVILGRRGI